MALTDAGITVEKNYTVTDLPPTIISTPSPTFVAENQQVQQYPMSQHWTDDGVSTVTSALTNVLPNGLTYDGNTHILEYDGVEPATTSQHQLEVTDAVDTVISASFDIEVTSADPLLVTLPTVIDEAAYYAGQGTTYTGTEQEVWFANSPADDDRFTGGWAAGVEPHGDTEGDDLWMALHMVKRYASIPAQQALWQTRAQNMRDWMVANLRTKLLSDQNYDHVYGWGLAEWYADNPGDSAALSTLNTIRADMEGNTLIYNGTVPGSTFIMQQGNSGRRWARVLRFAVALAEVDGQTANLTFRDKMIDLVLQDPGYDATYGVSWQGRNSTGHSGSGPFDYDIGDRTVLLFHMGLFADSLWQAWRVLTDESDSRAATCSSRLIAMADFWLTLGRTPANGWHGLDSGYNIESGSGPEDSTKLRSTAYGVGRNRHATGGVDGIYTISVVNNLVMAYKFTGDVSYLTEAQTIWDLWQETLSVLNAESGEVDHFADLIHQPDQTVMSNNKGELQYVYALFENGGNPQQVNSGIIPSWYTAANDKTWIDMSLSPVFASTFNDQDPELTFPNWDVGRDTSGADYHRAVIENWSGGIARNDFLVVFGGGHYGSPQNTVFEFGPFSSETPDWHWYGTDTDKYDIPSHEGTPNPTITDWATEEGVPYYSDGLPSSDHTYDHQTTIVEAAGTEVLFKPYSSSLFDNIGGVSSALATSFRFNVDDLGGSYDAQGTYSNHPGATGPGGYTEFDPVGGLVWSISTGSPGGKQVHTFNPVLNQWTQRATDIASLSFGNDTEGGALDYDRRIIIMKTNPSVSPFQNTLVLVDMTAGREGEAVLVTVSGLPNADLGMEYEPVGQVFIAYNGGATLYRCEPPGNYRNGDGSLNDSVSWTFSAVTNGSPTDTPSAAEGSGTYGRFRYIKSIKAFAVINEIGDSAYVYKIPAGGL